jgi:hypothetical protein
MTMRIVRSCIAVGALAGALLVPACASTGTGSSSSGGDRDLLTREQLEGMDHLTAYDAIRRLKPRWLQAERGQDSFASQDMRGTRVYVDGVLFGDTEALRRLDVRDIGEIRFLDKRRATTRFGTDHAEGAILISTRSG